MPKRLHILLACTACLLLAPAARAIQIQKISLGLGQNVSVGYGASNLNVFAGEFLMKFVGPPPTGYTQNFTAYCVDLDHWLQTYQEVDLLSTNLLNPAGLSPAAGPKVAWLYNTYAGLVGSALQAAALQLAIWEALYDSSLNLSAGTFKVNSANSATLNQANIYLGSLLNNTSEATYFRATSHPDQKNQHLIGPQVPEPGALALLLGAATTAGAALLRRKRAA